MKITVMEYDFESSLRNSVTRYESLAAECGASVSKRLRKTPYRQEPEHMHRLPAKAGPCVACPWCKNPFAPEDFKQYKSCKELDTEIRLNKMKIKAEVEEMKAQLPSARDNNSKHGGREGSATAGVPSKNMQKKIRKLDPRCTGRLAPVAANILMQVLCAGRYARCDTIICINMMACYVAEWTATQDQ